MVRGVYIDRAGSDRILLKHALDRYLREVSSTKKPSTHSAEQHKAKALKAKLGAYSLAAITPDLVAKYRDDGWRPASHPVPCDWNSPCCRTCSPSPSRNGVSACSTIR